MLRKIGIVAAFSLLIATGFTLKASAASVGTVTPWDGLNFRMGPSTSHNVIVALPQGTKVEVLSQENGWANAKTTNGVIGWVCSQYINIQEIIENTDSNKSGIDWNLTDRSNGTADRLVEYSKQFVGTRYVWGGASPGGFDCSGFMYYIFGKYGYALPRTAQSQYDSAGYAVERSGIQKGDLLFFGTSKSNITHVGMYIGNDEFIHARRTGVALSISNLSEYCNNNNYIGARRVLR